MSEHMWSGGSSGLELLQRLEKKMEREEKVKPFVDPGIEAPMICAS